MGLRDLLRMKGGREGGTEMWNESRPGFVFYGTGAGRGNSVLETGLEPARPFGHQSLKLACLPIPPLQRNSGIIAGRVGGSRVDPQNPGLARHARNPVIASAVGPGMVYCG